jgi:ribosome-associated protein
LTPAEPGAASRAAAAASAAAAKNGTDVAILEVGDIIGIVDRFVLVSASNTRQVRTIVDEVERVVHDLDGGQPIGVEGLPHASWVLIDFGDVVVHVFLDATRAYYDLDRLWADAARVDWDGAPAPVAADG